MCQSRGSQPNYQNINIAASASAADTGTPNRGQTHWVPSGMPRCGDEYVDFSCHALVQITPPTPTSKWRNDTFFFCSTFCRQRFAQAPDEFLTVRDIRDDSIRNGGSHAAAQPHD